MWLKPGWAALVMPGSLGLPPWRSAGTGGRGDRVASFRSVFRGAHGLVVVWWLING
jgi:hypothetical protein